MNRILIGDCLEKLKELPDGSIDCCITSPPYFGLRDYGTATWEGGDSNCSHRRETKKSDKTTTGHKNFDEMLGVGDAIQRSVCSFCGATRVDKQIGLEETPEEYTNKLVEVFREVSRVLKDEGTLWLNLGDSYNAGKGFEPQGMHKKRANFQNHKAKDRSVSRWGGGHNKVPDLKAKDLIGIPWRVAFALQADGWYLRSDIIWAKANPMPESVADRPTRSHEYIFLLTKKAKYYYDADSVREPLADSSKERIKYGFHSKHPSIAGDGEGIDIDVMGDRFANPKGRNKRSVWNVNTHAFTEAHFATFPEKLVEPMVLAGCPAGGVVLDPFFGAGTTGVVALKHGRQYVGVELNPDYAEIAEKRLSGTTLPLV